MKTVILAEKSSQAAAYASSFQKKATVAGNYVIQDSLFDGETVIVHASGHLLGLLQPEEYDPKWKKWSLDHLPIFPENYKYKIQYGKGKQMANTVSSSPPTRIAKGKISPARSSGMPVQKRRK